MRIDYAEVFCVPRVFVRFKGPDRRRCRMVYAPEALSMGSKYKKIYHLFVTANRAQV